MPKQKQNERVSEDFELSSISIEDEKSSEEKYKGSIAYLTEDDDENNEGQTLTWNNPLESLMYLLAYSIGLGNVWRFPSLAAKYGGGTFLVAYMLMVIIIGFPIMFMELALGQFSKSGPIDLYGNMAPLFRGLGFCMVVTVSLIDIYYTVVISWFIYYLFASFQPSLPWKDSTMDDIKFLGFEDHVNDWHNFGDLRWQMVLCLFAAWSLVCLLFFIDRIGKITAYFFGIAAFVSLLILMIFGATLEGAISGMELFVTPKLKNFNFDVSHFLRLPITIYTNAPFHAHI